MRNIFGLDEIHLVDVDGAPCGQKVKQSNALSILFKILNKPISLGICSMESANVESK